MDLGDFYNMRHIYAMIDGKLVWADEDGCNDMCAHDWLTKCRGLTEEQFESTIRGGVFSDHITLCVGYNYEPVNLDYVPSKLLHEVVDVACKMNGINSVRIYNGAKVGEPGTVWPPICDLGYFARS